MRRKDREIKDIDELESIIGRSDVCRVAFAGNNIPYIVTLNFGYKGGTSRNFYFHCSNQGRKIDMIRINNLVCFELDTDHRIFKGEKACDWGMNYSSVVGYGRISIVTDEKERIEGLDHIMVHYGSNGVHSYNEKLLPKTTVLKLEISEMTGKKNEPI